jgi:hypothetical protein
VASELKGHDCTPLHVAASRAPRDLRGSTKSQETIKAASRVFSPSAPTKQVQ